MLLIYLLDTLYLQAHVSYRFPCSTVLL